MTRKRDKKNHQVDRFFAERGFGKIIGFGERPAILVIDMINAFTDKRYPLGTRQDIQIGKIKQILKVAREKAIPIFFTATKYEDRNFADAGLWLLKQKGLMTLRAGTRKTEIDSRLRRQFDEPIIVKKYASSFFGTDLVTRLNMHRIDTVILTGCTTSGCIRATAVDAIQLGFRPVIIAEAVADRSVAAHKQSLFDLHAKYADVVSIKEALTYLQNLHKVIPLTQ